MRKICNNFFLLFYEFSLDDWSAFSCSKFNNAKIRQTKQCCFGKKILFSKTYKINQIGMDTCDMTMCCDALNNNSLIFLV